MSRSNGFRSGSLAGRMSNRSLRRQVLNHATALVIVLVSLAGCTRLPSPELSPLPTAAIAASPLVSPSATPTSLPEPVALSGTASASYAPAMLLSQAEKIALSPDDISDLFEAGYSIVQEYDRPGMRGIQVLYPTMAVAHTTDFAMGFETRLEAFDEEADARSAFESLRGEDTGADLPLNVVADQFSATVSGSRDGNDRVAVDAEGVTTYVYSLVARDANVLALVTLKAPDRVPSARLEEIMKAVVDRLRRTRE